MIEEGRQNGRRKQRSLTVYGPKADAKRAVTEALSRLDRGVYVKPTKVTVGEFMDEWLAAIRSQVRPSTWDSYRRNVEYHVKPAVGSIPLQRLSADRLNAFYAGLLESGKRNGGGGGLSPRSVRYIHTIVRKALSDAIRWDRLVRNPADQADPPSATATKPKPPKTWSAEELRRFLDHVRDDPLYPAWLTLATTGMRRGELLGLRWREVDLKTGRISIQRAITAIRYEVVETEPKTKNSRRSVALDAQTVAALKSLPRSLPLDAPLFPGVHPDEFSKAFQRHVRTAGLPRLSIHGLRHTHASLALAAGVDPKVVSERLGHATVAITLDVYSHAIPSMQEEAATQVATLLFGKKQA